MNYKVHRSIKWLLFFALLGISEIAVIGELHARFGLYKLVGLYILTTSIGVLFLLIQLSEFRKAMEFLSSLERNIFKEFNDDEFKPNAKQIEKLRPMVYFMLYVRAAILIAIPGIVSDVIGILLVIPFINNHLMNLIMNKAKYKRQTQ